MQIARECPPDIAARHVFPFLVRSNSRYNFWRDTIISVCKTLIFRKARIGKFCFLARS
jgi:hypothetical protein